jgi:hypothetical protein
MEGMGPGKVCEGERGQTGAAQSMLKISFGTGQRTWTA